MKVWDALATTGVIIALPTIACWIVFGIQRADLTVYDVERQWRWKWPVIFGSLALASLVVIVLWIAAAWVAVGE